MARKREPLDPNAGQRLLQNKLKILHGASARRSNFALDILTGRTQAPESAERFESPHPTIGNGELPGTTEPTSAIPVTVSEKPVSHLAPEDGGTAAPARRRGAMVARTVYLSDQDVRDIDFIVRAWRRRIHKRVSRSEVLRQAIGNLRDAVELGAAPRVTNRFREESKSDG